MNKFKHVEYPAFVVWYAKFIPMWLINKIQKQRDVQCIKKGHDFGRGIFDIVKSFNKEFNADISSMELLDWGDTCLRCDTWKSDYHYHENCYKVRALDDYRRKGVIRPQPTPEKPEEKVGICPITNCGAKIDMSGYYCSSPDGTPYCEEHSYLLLDKVVEHNLHKLQEERAQRVSDISCNDCGISIGEGGVAVGKVFYCWACYNGEPPAESTEESEVEVIEELHKLTNTLLDGNTYTEVSIDLQVSWNNKINELVRGFNRLAKKVKLEKEK